VGHRVITGAAEARQVIAQRLGTALGPSVAVFPQPPETVTAPGVVVAPGSPYRSPSTYCQYELRLRIVAFVQRASPDAMDLLDEMMDVIVACVRGIEWLTWTNVADIGTTQEVGSVEYLTASIDLIAYI
jgi:hypothetical protein